MKKIYFLLVIVLWANGAWAQMTIPDATAQTQDFTSLGSSASAALPSGFRVSTGTTYSAGTSICTNAYGTTGTGVVTSSSSGAAVNWANGITASSTDRALGFLSSGTITSPRNIMLELQNTSGSTITSLSITFDYEKYRSGSRAWDMNFFSGTDGISWTAQTTGDQSYAADANNTVVSNPPITASKSVTITGLNIVNNGKYYLRWSYTGSGGSSNAQGLGLDNLSLTATLSAATTGQSTVVAGTTPAPATISSLVNTNGAAATNFSFKIVEDGGVDDADPTLINQVVINQGTNNSATLANWTQAIAGAELSDGTNTVTGTVNATNISFTLANAATTDIGYIADNGNKEYTLKVWLKSALGGTLPTTIDGKQFEFLVQSAGISTAGTGSSGIAASQSVSAGVNTNVVAVSASQLVYLQQTTSPTGQNTPMTPSVTVAANDINGNRDLDFVEQIRITSTGTLAGTPVDVAAVAGVATFSTLTHTATGTGFTLNAERTNILDWDITSNPFDIIIPSSSSDYFRSSGITGNWATLGSWESSPDNSTWNQATLIPDENANTIYIRNGHTMTINTTVSADQVVIQNGGVLSNTGGAFTLKDGAGDDMIIENGGVFVAGTGSANVAFSPSTATVNVNTGGTLRVSKTGYTASGSGVNAANFIYQNGSILEYTLTSAFSASGVTFFPNVDAITIPVFRTTAALSVGGAGNTAFNGLFEANAAITFTGAGTKTFRNGIIGTGNIDGSASGKFIVNGSSATLGGTGGLIVPTATSIEVSTTTNVTSAKTITGNLSLLPNGYLQLNNNNVTVTGAITGGDATSYIKTNGTGSLILKNVTTATVFPVGNGTSYTPATITNTGTADDFAVNVTTGTPCNADPFQSVNRVWTITEATAGGSNADITLQWNVADENLTFIRLACAAVHCSAGGVIDKEGTTGVAASNGAAYTQTITGVTSFSPFGVTSDQVALPLGITYFRGAKQGSTNNLSWKVNCASSPKATMTVERSADGRNFSPIHTITATAVECLSEFSYVDATPLPGLNYYKLRSVDADGKAVYSSILTLLNKEKGLEIVDITPNPNKGQFRLNVTSAERAPMDIIIVDMQGRVVSTTNTTLISGYNGLNINVSQLNSGMYQVYGITADGRTKPVNFIKQ